MCLFNLRLLSICMPRSFTVSVVGNFFPAMLRRRHLSSFRPRNIIWNFSGFAIIQKRREGGQGGGAAAPPMFSRTIFLILLFLA